MGKGSECGMSFTDWQDFQPGDIAQCYEEWEEKRRLQIQSATVETMYKLQTGN